MNSLFVESINYSPSCQSHGEMKQQRGNDGYFWICKTNSCKNTRSGINQKSFLNLLRDLNPNIIENKDHIKKNLLYFPHLLKTDLSVLVEALKYEIDNFNDIDGLLSLINICDMVLSVSNTTVHLAGGIGKKTILMLPKGKGNLWYWSKEEDQSIWYKSVRVFQQDVFNSWDKVINRIYKEII